MPKKKAIQFKLPLETIAKLRELCRATTRNQTLMVQFLIDREHRVLVGKEGEKG